ncbi:alkaline phosphatase family protein [Psychromonas sp.]|uniref:alkaline phosphatase family protein n=1 Tax=Psychromonas sp. TaxID=1884585 RepID=UPI00356336D1
MKKHNRPLLFTFMFSLSSLFFANPVSASGHIKLILQITVDGLRGDLLARYQHHYGKDGFRYLLEHGVYYANAHYSHANTTSVVGHATLATGSYPADHGIVADVWLDPVFGQQVNNIADPNAPILQAVNPPSADQSLSPTGYQRPVSGRSPRIMLGTTFSDQLFINTAGRSRVFAVSGKDQGAVPMAGHMGKAFWFSTDNGEMVTSGYYYYDSYPQWVTKWNSQKLTHSYAQKAWELRNNREDYIFSEQDNRSYEVDLNGFANTFPHPYSSIEQPLYNTLLMASPAGDKLLADFAKQLIISETLGSRVPTDYLSVSFSSLDAVNQIFGPSSLENEDLIATLDQTLADLLQFVDKQIGLENTLVVLSGAHGMAEAAEYITELGLSAGEIRSDEIYQFANDVAKKEFAIDNLVKAFIRPYIYLDKNKIRLTNLQLIDVEMRLANALSQYEGIALALPASDITALENTPAGKQIKRNFHAQRSGDIYIAQSPYWQLRETDTGAVSNGSPWSYDTYVPIIFAGANLKAQRIDRAVDPVDIAPTLASMMAITPPSKARGAVLEEVVSQRP